MKRIRPILALLVALLLMTGLTRPALTEAAVKLNKTKLTLSEGDTYKLLLSGTSATAKWTSSDKTVAKVGSKSGKITAVSEGTATITAKVKGKKYKCKLTVVSSEEHVMFDGQAKGSFRKWGDNWKEALGILDVDMYKADFSKPFTVKVEYSGAAPILVFQSWTGGTSWGQMEPTYTSSGTAYFTYSLISSAYGTDFSKLNKIGVFPSPSQQDITVTRVSFVYESDEIIKLPFKGLSGQIINDIKVGWNLGNTLDSNGDWIKLYTSGKTSDYETAWGNPITTKAMIESVKAQGFNAIRVPVTWSQHIDDKNGYKIDEAWMARVKEVVDYVIDSGLYCIINVHHDTGEKDSSNNVRWLFASTDNYKKNSSKYAAVWKQIATTFKNYDNKLLFESFNEMLNEGNSWSYPGADAGDAINAYNQLFVDTVRKTGGNNAGRCLVVNTYAASSTAAALEAMKIPKDSASNALMVQVHYYSPWEYCNDISANSCKQTKWQDNGGKGVLDSTLINLYNCFTSKGIPVIIGETAAAAKKNEDDRAEWADYLVSTAKDYGIRCFWWDHGGKFEKNEYLGEYGSMALYNRFTDKWMYAKIVKALTKNR